MSMKFGLGHWVLRNHTFLFNEIPRNVIKFQCKTGLYKYIVCCESICVCYCFYFRCLESAIDICFMSVGMAATRQCPSGSRRLSCACIIFCCGQPSHQCLSGLTTFGGASGAPLGNQYGRLLATFGGASGAPLSDQYGRFWDTS